MKLLLLGFGQNGKDTVAEYWQEKFGLTFSSSSLSASKIFLFGTLKDKYNYTTLEDCFNDRHNHRQEWYDLIKDYNKEDGARLCKQILETSNCYVGMRSTDEFNASKELFDLIIWVDAEQRVGIETGSCDLDKRVADIIIDNNGTEAELYNKLDRLGKILFK